MASYQRVGILALLTAYLVSCASGMYTKSSGVVELTDNNFDNRVKDSDGVWIVEFYAPWCGHCQNLAPEYQKAAQALKVLSRTVRHEQGNPLVIIRVFKFKGIINVGAVDCDTHKSLCGQYGVRGFPTIKIFGANKKSPEDFQGERTANGIVQAAQKAAQKIVQVSGEYILEMPFKWDNVNLLFFRTVWVGDPVVVEREVQVKMMSSSLQNQILRNW